MKKTGRPETYDLWTLLAAHKNITHMRKAKGISQKEALRELERTGLIPRKWLDADGSLPVNTKNGQFQLEQWLAPSRLDEKFRAEGRVEAPKLFLSSVRGLFIEVGRRTL